MRTKGLSCRVKIPFCQDIGTSVLLGFVTLERMDLKCDLDTAGDTTTGQVSVSREHEREESLLYKFHKFSPIELSENLSMPFGYTGKNYSKGLEDQQHSCDASLDPHYRVVMLAA